MFLWVIVEPIIMMLAALFIITQVAIPAIRNKPAFPFFRKIFRHRRAIENEIRELKTIQETEEIESEKAKLKKQLKIK